MNTATNPRYTPLPSLDWIAFGLALACSALGYVIHQLSILVPIVLFLPSVLRELGVIKDMDEFTREVMHRAGFHALLVSALLVFGVWSFARPVAPPLSSDLLTGETLRKIMMYTFVVSYLLQYWGAREGSFRLLLGMAVWTLTPLVAVAARPEMYSGGVYTFAFVGGLALLTAGLAFVVRSRPQLGGILLMVVFVGSMGMALGMLHDEALLKVAIPSIVMQTCIFPGAMSLALLFSWHG